MAHLGLSAAAAAFLAAAASAFVAAPGPALAVGGRHYHFRSLVS